MPVDAELNSAYFDYNKSTLTDAAKAKLDLFVKSLVYSPDTVVLVSGHADSRGSKGYNQVLSERRAKAAMEYMISKGVNRARIESKGFGEEKLKNKCSDGVNCSEAEHAKNRRVELRFQIERK
jgi:outer membrane protein OmpA-like peptidoglycan-associated protein